MVNVIIVVHLLSLLLAWVAIGVAALEAWSYERDKTRIQEQWELTKADAIKQVSQVIQSLQNGNNISVTAIPQGVEKRDMRKES